jgi:hypothetical protein
MTMTTTRLLDLRRPYLDQINEYRRFQGRDEIIWRMPDEPSA